MKLSEKSKDLLISELPETTQGRIAYYQYAKRRIEEIDKESQKLGFLNYLKNELGELVK